MKLTDGKTVGGIGWLTDKVIDKMQNFYGQCIRNHISDIEGMQNSMWAIVSHMIAGAVSFGKIGLIIMNAIDYNHYLFLN